MVSTATIPIIIDRNEYFRSFLPTVNPSSLTPQREHGSSPAVACQRAHQHAHQHTHQHAQQHVDSGRSRAALPGDTMAVDVRDKSKKHKKWSLGKLFRRKKKDAETSSSESDDSLSQKVEVKRKKTSVKKKRPQTAAVSSFDHIVSKRPENKRAQSLVKCIPKEEMDEGVLSDPSAGFVNYRGRGLPQAPCSNDQWFGSRDNFEKRTSGGSCNTSQDGSLRKGRKGRMKARVEAIRNSMRKDSSSDEDSQKSSASSSMVRFRSDDSLVNTSKDGSLSRRSRSARTERYIKRLSRDDENQLNKEAELLQQGYTKAEVELLTRTPTSQSNGYGTAKQEIHGNIVKTDVGDAKINYKPVKSESISSFPSMRSCPSAVNFSGKINNESFNYSMPYNQSSNKSYNPSFINTRDSNSERRVFTQQDDSVLTVKFPLGNVNTYQTEDRAPPVPPPRDFQRKAPTPVRNLQDARKHNAALSDQKSFTDSKSAWNEESHIQRRNLDETFSLKQHYLGQRRPISEDQYLWNNRISNYNKRNVSEQRRPASVSTEIVNPDYYSNLPLNYKMKDGIHLNKPTLIKPGYIYYADQCPRSRKPIHIKSSQNKLDQQHYLSDSQASLYQSDNRNSLTPGSTRNATEFWKKIDDDECQRKRQVQFSKSRASSDQTNLNIIIPSKRHTIMPNYSFHNDRSKPIVVKSDYQNRLMNTQSNILLNTKNEADSVRFLRPGSIIRQSQPVEINAKVALKSHVRHKSDSFIRPISKNLSDDDKTSVRRKSTNLDDALNELEAIYNSLGLGDEDLLDRAERRERLNSTSNAAQQRDQSYRETTLNLTTDQIQYRRKSNVPDKVQDDMAYRRLTSKDRNSRDLHLKSPQMMYMLASPAFGPYSSDDDKHSGDGQEPDIIHDDVVFRNIKHANNHLKIIEPQPPFGIPIGPVSPAPQSDYLHVTPENKLRPRFIPRKSPDIVSDDLAYRSLRKDSKSQSLFENVENQMNNNIENGEISASIKKKRAVRSLSANIFTMIQQEIDEALNMSKLATSHKAQSISDINKSLLRNPGQDKSNPEMKMNKLSKNRHNTVNLLGDFSSNDFQSILLAKKNDQLSANKYLTKPPISIEKSKSSSPSNRSSLTNNKYTKDEFQHVLSLLAQEAMDTSNKLGVALAEIDRNSTSSRNSLNNDSIVRNNQFLLVSNQNIKVRPTLLDLSNANHKRDIKQEKANLYVKVEDTLKLDPDIANSPNIKARKTEDSLLAISNQLQKVENKLKNTFDKEVTFANEDVQLAVMVTNIENNTKINEENSLLTSNSQPLRQKRDNKDISQDLKPAYISSSTKVEVEAEDFDKITMFDDLRQGISELLNGISQVNDKLKIKSREETNDEKEVLEEKNIRDQHGGDENVKGGTPDYNSSEELSNIFRLDDKSIFDKPDNNHVHPDGRNSEFNSPRLVQDTNRKLSSCDSSVGNDDHTQPNQCKVPPMSSQVVPWRNQRQNPNPNNSERDDCNNYHSSKDPPWYRVPGNLVLACSYTLVCTQQLAYLDWLTILGLILAMITIIAMLLM